MSRKVDNPRIILLDCPLEYKKGESQTSVEMTAETDFTRIGDEGPSKDIVNEVERNLQDALGVAWNLALEPRLVPGGSAVGMAVSNFLQQKAKGVSGVRQWPYSALAQALEDGDLRIPHGGGYIFLEFKDRAAAEEAVRQRNNYKLDKQHTFLCNLFTDFEKYDNIPEEFVAPVPEPYKIGDEYFTFITKCQDPKACTVLLRGPSKDILNEVRVLLDGRECQTILH
ncbi:hypothetical protein O3P69_007502 [Scylla paramamosain]|uniref:RRM domain-containing protein n=1 Tax=Scylla paramamosain TaxID=85552 RepID=A0AAW0V7F4_SCYPA